MPCVQTNENLGGEGGSFPLRSLHLPRGFKNHSPQAGETFGQQGLRDLNMNTTGTTENYDYYSVDPSIPVDGSSNILSVPDIIALIIFVFVFLVGVPGNALVVWVTKSEARRTINAIWFLNLAVADLLSCLALPTLFVSIIYDNHWFLGDAACRILPSLILLNMYASILLLATISADRFLLVFNPIWCQNYRGAYLAWIACGVAWVSALLLIIPSFMFRREYHHHFPSKTICVVDYGGVNTHTERTVAVLRLVLGYLWPLVTLTICYTFLLIRAWSRSATRSTKTLKVVVAVVASFFVFWLPYQVTGLMIAFFSKTHPSFHTLSRLDNLWVSIAYINCCINPIIYVAAAQGFHSRLLKSLPAGIRNVLTEETALRDTKSSTLSTADTLAQKDQAV